MAIKKTSKKKVSKKKSVRRAIPSIESVLETVSSQASISPACKQAVVNYNAAVRSLTATNKKVISLTERFEKSLANLDKAKTPKQKDLAKSRLTEARAAKTEIISDARIKTKAMNDAEKLVRALDNLYSASFTKFQKDFARNAAAKAKALAPGKRKRRAPRKKAVTE